MKRHAQTIYGRAFIAGRWRPVTGNEVVPVVNPVSEKTYAVVQSAGEPEIAAACESAVRAANAWSCVAIADRANLLNRIASDVEARSESLARRMTEEIGTPIIESRTLQVAAAVRVLRRTAEIGSGMRLEETIGSAKVFRVPVGVVACITPWNYPLFQIACKIAPALVAGCTVVLKPSEVAPGSAMDLAEIIAESGMPDGVFNMVMGSGSAVGESLIRNPALDAVSFTGSVRGGARVGAICGESLKRVSLELGGKSPSVVLPDANLSLAVERTMAKCFQNAGQTCAALTKLIVPDGLLDHVIQIVADRARHYSVGDPNLESTQIGPLATARQRSRVRELMFAAGEEGAQLVTGGPDAPPGMAKGFYVQPSAYVVAPQMRIAREEVFGPVLAVLPYSDLEEALQLANDGDYGLSGAVWSGDLAAAETIARKIRSGSISVNGEPTNPDAPFGGFKRSGFGRERGRYGIEEFLTTQAVHRGA